MEAAECCVICTTNEKSRVQKSKEECFTNSSLGIRIITYNYVAFSRFFVFAQIIGNKIEGERASFYFSNCGTREEIRRGWCCPWSVWRIRNRRTGVGFTGRCCRYCKFVGCRCAAGKFHVLRAAQHEWHFSLVKQGCRFVWIQTLEILMAAELSHIISRNIGI